jgi:hypothetical protein
MNRPPRLIQLLEELRAASTGTTVVTISSSSATISLSGEVDGFQLLPEECELLFDSPDTVEQLYEAIDTPNDATLELHNLSVEDEVMEALHETFSSVEEV